MCMRWPSGAPTCGTGADASGGTNATAVGQNAKATANNATAYGNGANAAGVNATALGQNANALADNSSAVGNGATVAASHTNAAAFGAGATTPRANQQSFGTASNTYTMAGITSNASKARHERAAERRRGLGPTEDVAGGRVGVRVGW
jgi:trimeric autotransporter adhesin